METLKQAQDNFESLLEKYKIKNQCLQNCRDCCYDFFFVSYAEFKLTYSTLKSEFFWDHNYFLKQALKHYDHFKKRLPNILKLIDPTLYNNQYQSFIIDHDDLDKKKLSFLPPCIYLSNGMCLIYDVRPNICRLYGTTITCQYIDNHNHWEKREIQEGISNLYQDQGIRLPLWYWYLLIHKERHH